MEIRRDFYLDKLIKRKNNGLIKVITGIRRCGKSYLLNNLFYHHLLESGVDDDHIIRFAFDSAEDLYLIGESLIQIEKEKRGVDPEKFMAYIRSKVVGEGMYYLLLDEIQMLDCFEAVLNGYLLYRLTSHISPVAVFISVAKTTELFLEFVFIQKLPCFGIVVLYDCQCRVVYNPGDIYHITKVSEVIAAIQFYCQCPHDIIIAHFMALRITAFHPTAKARGLSQQYICNFGCKQRLPIILLWHLLDNCTI